VKLSRVATALAVLLLAACGRGEPPPAAVPPVAPAAQDAELVELAEAWFEELLALNPLAATFMGDERYNDRLANDIGPEHRAAVEALVSRYSAALDAFDPARLQEEGRVTRDVFRYILDDMEASLAFPAELLPVNQLFNLPQLVAVFGSGASAQPFRNADDYRAFMSRMDDLAVWIDQAIENMRLGIERGVVHPRVVIEKIVPQFDALLADPPEATVFWGAIEAMPEDIEAEQRAALVEAWRERVAGTLLPAYARMRDFLRDEYLPAGRETVAWTALPAGEEWYAWQVRKQTTTEMTPAEIHRLGLSEVARIRAGMDGVRRAVGFEGDLAAFFEFLKTDSQFFFETPDEVLAAYLELKARIDAALPALFSVFPRSDYEVRAVEEFRAESAPGAFYQPPSMDGSRPGIFYVNTFNLKAQPRYGTETLSLHEAAPGHHFQIALAQEQEHLPRLRRFANYNAYAEGWALYAESLGPELGLFTDPYQYFGRLNDEQLRAMRLVVDTGLHAFGWSREQAIDYMLENSSLAETDVIAEVERYIAWPGQALGYKIGEFALHDMRAAAEQALGERFDLKAWHAMILTGGALPLEVLAARNHRWIAAQLGDR
jgi:uncharacterized protein (DUF885 family)